MPPRPVHGSPEEWLRRAEASLALAKVQSEGVLLEDLCYQAQQAAEKAMKALYIARGKEFLFTHDLDRLAMGLELIGFEITEPIDQATTLTRYAMDTRYPGRVRAGQRGRTPGGHPTCRDGACLGQGPNRKFRGLDLNKAFRGNTNKRDTRGHL